MQGHELAIDHRANMHSMSAMSTDCVKTADHFLV